MRQYTQINKEERGKIYLYLNKGISLTKIAEKLGRSKSSISREVSRNSCKDLGYLPDRAEALAMKRKERNISKINDNPKLKQYIIERLTKDKWSPEMIAGRMKIEKFKVTISHETIYKFIYSMVGQKLRLYKSLMYKRARRREHYSRRHRYHVPECNKIANRPDNINNREEFGHFEGDLTFFKKSKSGNVITLIERKSRKVFLIKNNNKRSDETMLKISKKISNIDNKTNITKSITFDNGGEFKKFGLLSIMGIKTFFCKPGAPYQKGQVERANAILHKFIPKKSNFFEISNHNIIEAQDKMNNLPKKTLNFLTPNEVWNNLTNNNNVALHT